MPNFHETLKQVRISRGLTQEKMAYLLDIKRSTYSLYESGKRMPKTETLDKIAEALDAFIYYDHEAHQYQLIAFENGQVTRTIRTYADPNPELTRKMIREQLENNSPKIDQANNDSLSYDNSYSYASSEEEFDKLQKEYQTETGKKNINIDEYKVNNHVEITPELKERSRIQSKILNDKESVTEEELKVLSDYYQSEQYKNTFKRIKESAQNGLEIINRLQTAYETLNEGGQEKVAEHAEMIAKIPEYRKNPPQS